MIYGLAGIGAVAVVLLVVAFRLNRKLAGANDLTAVRQKENERLLEAKASEVSQLAGQLREARSEITELSAANRELNERVESSRQEADAAAAAWPSSEPT